MLVHPYKQHASQHVFDLKRSEHLMGGRSLHIDDYLVILIVKSVYLRYDLKLGRLVVCISEVFKVVNGEVFVYLAFSADGLDPHVTVNGGVFKQDFPDFSSNGGVF